MVSGENFSMPNGNVSTSGINVSRQLLSGSILMIPTECLSSKSLSSIVNVLIEDLKSAKSRIAQLEYQQASIDKEQVRIPETGKLNE